MSSNPAEEPSQTHSDHLLPAPQDAEATKVDVSSSETVKLDSLGPMVINSDGTVSRIANWHQLTDAEKERTMRVLNARNQSRLRAQRELQESHEANQK